MNTHYMLYAVDLASWALSPFPWFFFSGAMAYYAYKVSFRETSVVFCIALAYVALIVGFIASVA